MMIQEILRKNLLPSIRRSLRVRNPRGLLKRVSQHPPPRPRPRTGPAPAPAPEVEGLSALCIQTLSTSVLVPESRGDCAFRCFFTCGTPRILTVSLQIQECVLFLTERPGPRQPLPPTKPEPPALLDTLATPPRSPDQPAWWYSPGTTCDVQLRVAHERREAEARNRFVLSKHPRSADIVANPILVDNRQADYLLSPRLSSREREPERMRVRKIALRKEQGLHLPVIRPAGSGRRPRPPTQAAPRLVTVPPVNQDDAQSLNMLHAQFADQTRWSVGNDGVIYEHGYGDGPQRRSAQIAPGTHAYDPTAPPFHPSQFKRSAIAQSYASTANGPYPTRPDNPFIDDSIPQNQQGYGSSAHGCTLFPQGYPAPYQACGPAFEITPPTADPTEDQQALSGGHPSSRLSPSAATRASGRSYPTTVYSLQDVRSDPRCNPSGL